MTSEDPTCRACGSQSSDREWCDTCGADLTAQRSADFWLEAGATVNATLAQVRADASLLSMSQDVDLGDTLLPGARTVVDGNVTTPVTIDLKTLTLPRKTGTKLRTVELTLNTMLAALTHKRVWEATDGEGNLYRVEERAVPSPEAIPESISALAWLVDVPLGATTHGDHEVRIYRDVPGRTMHERLEARDTPLTPTEIVEWLRPVCRAIHAIHEAGFLCLRVCPYTVKYTRDGGVFFQNVEVLYPRDTALAALPAIAGYTAPEIYHAEIGTPPDVAADIYSVGMLTYFLVAECDPPTSLYTNHAPVILARDHQPEFPLGFAPVIEVLSAAEPTARPSTIATSVGFLEAARDRAVQQTASSPPPHVAVAADTHIGILKRIHNPKNQDDVFAATYEDTSILVVADGVSTATFGSGDRASELTIAAFRDAWSDHVLHQSQTLDGNEEDWLRAALQDANERIVADVNENHAPFSGEPAEVMGSTCVAALIRGGVATVISIGDSRAYLMRDDYFERVTRDHNLLTLGVIDGLDPDTAVTLPQGEALARCLGAFDVDEEGHLISEELQADAFRFALLSRDRLLICSDGLTDYAADSEAQSEARIHQAVIAEEVPELACLALISLANRGGGGDNIGVAAAYVDPDYDNVVDWYRALGEESE